MIVADGREKEEGIREEAEKEMKIARESLAGGQENKKRGNKQKRG